MKTFKLKIITPEKVFFDGDTEQVIVRTTEGDTGVLYGHENYVANLPAGPFRVKIDGKFKIAAISGGVIKADAMKRIKESQSDYDLKMAELKLKRALNRINISSLK